MGWLGVGLRCGGVGVESCTLTPANPPKSRMAMLPLCKGTTKLGNQHIGLSVVHLVSSSLSGPVVPSFRALSGRLKLTARRHKFNQDSLPSVRGGGKLAPTGKITT